MTHEALTARRIMWRRTPWLLCVHLLLVGAASKSFAQGNATERRFRTRPFLVHSAAAPMATVRCLGFTKGAGGRLWLYSAGDDKVVRKWSVAAAAGGVEVRQTQKIAWPIFRDIRGVIYAMDAVDDGANGPRLAFGGVGALTAQVNAMFPNRPDQAEALAHPKLLSNQVVRSMDVHRDASGQCWLAAGHDRAGMIPLWKLSAQVDGESVHARDVTSQNLETIQHVAFSPQGDMLAAAGVRKGAAGLGVEVYELGKPRLAPFANAVTGRLTDLIWIDNKTWVAGTESGAVYRVLPEKAVHPVKELAGKRIVAMAPLAGGGRAVVSLAEEIGDKKFRHRVALWTPGGGVTPLDSPFVDWISAVAASPDGRYVAAAGLAPVGGFPVVQICLWKVATGRRVATVPDSATASHVGGPIANVAFLPGIERNGIVGSPSIGFTWGQWHRGQPRKPISRAINLAVMEMEAFRDTQPAAQQWTFLLDPKQGWHLVRIQRPASEVRGRDVFGPLPAKSGGAIHAHLEFVHQASGKRLLAVGYDRGILAWDAAQFRQATARGVVLRGFYGHSGPVTALSASPDGAVLISGGLDGTICAWSLEGIGSGSELGVVLENRGGWVVANDPNESSPGWEAGFVRGQTVTSLTYRGRRLADARITSILRPFDYRGRRYHLLVPEPGEELLVSVTAAGKSTTLLTQATHDPLWTLYPMFDGHWTLVTPQGYFKTSQGFNRFEWLINFDPAAERSVGENKQQALATLLPGLVYDDTLRKETRVDEVIDTNKPAPPPEGVLPPSFRFNTSGDVVTVTVAANGPEKIAGPIELRVNGTVIPPAGGAALSRSWRIDRNLLRAGSNQLFAIATVTTAKGPRRFTGIHPLPDGPGAAAQTPTIHFLGIGVENVASAAGLKLNFSEDDVKELKSSIDALAAATGRPAGFVATLTGSKATKANITAALDKLAAATRPRDLAMVMLSGHGFVGAGGSGFSFIAHDSDFQKLSTGVTGAELRDLLGKLKCRSVLLLDTCHAGGAGSDEQLDAFPDRSVGPLILAACRRDQKSLEPTDLGHGVFTGAILEALTGNSRLPGGGKLAAGALPLDDGGWLTVGGLCRYVIGRTPDLRVAYGQGRQNPKVFTSNAFRDFETVRLWRPSP